MCTYEAIVSGGVNTLLTLLGDPAVVATIRNMIGKETSMTLMTLPGKILDNAHHTLILMREGEVCHAVCVINDGRIGNVRSKLALIETIASRKLDHGEVAFDGRVWITPSDLPQPAAPVHH